ncbi:hypothetical protein cypCar_00039726 [Cyprinus carpio]|nr:hypothetical protein cypCar_00039726 [Cyprinus carpio]
MNVDQDRPYVCAAPGCSQRFQREDHLIIHRHKHEMTLKFPSIKCDSVLSDQTPTPTRFLRDCEEVGLFTDLELNQSQAEEETKPNFPAQASGQNQAHTETQHQQSQHHQFQPQQQQQCALAHLNQNQLHTHSSQPQSQCTATYSTSNKHRTATANHRKDSHINIKAKTNHITATLTILHLLICILAPPTRPPLPFHISRYQHRCRPHQNRPPAHNLLHSRPQPDADGQQGKTQMSADGSFWRETELPPHGADRRERSG